MKITTEQELVPFNVPNYVLTKAAVRPRQEGFKETPKYAIHELDDKTLDLLCRKFRDDVFAKAAAGRSGDPQP